MEKDLELAWAAGFFEGEGTLYLRTGRPKVSKSLMLSMSQVDIEPLNRLVSILGGKVYGPYKNGPLSRKLIYQYSIRGDDALSALNRLIPFLSTPKKTKVGKVLECLS